MAYEQKVVFIKLW